MFISDNNRKVLGKNIVFLYNTFEYSWNENALLRRL